MKPFLFFFGYPSFGQTKNHRLHCWWYNPIIFPFHCGLNNLHGSINPHYGWLCMGDIFFTILPAIYIVISIPFHCGSIPPIIMNIINIIYIILSYWWSISMISPFYLHFSSIVGDPVETPTKRPRNAHETPCRSPSTMRGSGLPSWNSPLETNPVPGRYLGDTWTIRWFRCKHPWVSWDFMVI